MPENLAPTGAISFAMDNLIKVFDKIKNNFLNELNLRFFEIDHSANRHSMFPVFSNNNYDFLVKQECIKSLFRKHLVVNALELLLPPEPRHTFKSSVDSNLKERASCFDYDYFYKKEEFAFIIDDVGYCFNKKNHSIELLEKLKISKLMEINFSNNCRDDFVLNFNDFLKNYFDENTINEYLNFIMFCLDIANQKCGYLLVKQMSIQNVASFKSSTFSKIKTFDFFNEKYEYGEDNFDLKELSGDTQKKISENINKINFYCLLLGNNDFSKCFLTAEYLYDSLKKQKHFDYTSVVCGYLKAVENILYTFHLSSGDSIKLRYDLYNPNNKNEIAKFNARKGILVNYPFILNKKVYKYESTSPHIEMSDLIKRLKYDKRFWLVDYKDREIIFNILDSFKSKCRNEHLHIDNIYDEDDVEKIRTNALICIYLLFGGFNLIDTTKLDLSFFNPLYNKLYNFIVFEKAYFRKYIFEINGVQYKCFRIKNNEETIYNENSAMIESDIVFKIVDTLDASYETLDNLQVDSSKMIKINSTNIPDKIYLKVCDKLYLLKG